MVIKLLKMLLLLAFLALVVYYFGSQVREAGGGLSAESGGQSDGIHAGGGRAVL
jgi:hypothetical protein